MNLRTVVVTTDFSDCARAAYASAAMLAQRFGANLHLVHARENFVPYGFMGHSGVEKLFETYHQQIERDLQKEATSKDFGGLEVTGHYLDHYGAEAVATFAKTLEADLVVQASHGFRGFKRFVLGSFAERVLRSTECPVLTVKPRSDGTPKPLEIRRILVPYDFSELAKTALPTVREWANALEAKVYMVHAFPVPMVVTGAYASGGGVTEALKRAADMAKSIESDLRKIAQEDLSGVEVEVVVQEGYPGSVLAKLQKELNVDLVSMATHGWTGLRHTLLGSVAERLVRDAECPVLTIKPVATGS